MFDFVKENINIRVKGFGDVKEFSEFRITFSRKGNNKEVQKLATHLNYIIKFKKKYIAKNGKPQKPASESKKTFISPILGTITDQRRQLDAKKFKTSEKLREAAGKLHTERKLRKANKSLYYYFQPWSMPTGKQLVNRRIDFMSMINNELEWCQGNIMKCIKDDPPLVIVQWGEILDVDGYETKVEAEEELVPNKCRKQSNTGWRIDLDVELFENYHGHIDKASIDELDDIEMEVVEEEEEVELDKSNDCEDVDEEYKQQI